MPNATEIATRYIALWNEPDSSRRLDLVAGAFADDANYTDPIAAVSGHEAISSLIGAVQQQFAGHRFALRGTQDEHHDLIRFSWSLEDGGAAPVARGTDIATIGSDGRLQNVMGFLDGAAP